MSGLKTLGIILIVAGAVLLGYQKISYNKKHDILGIATVTTTETKKVPMWVGFVLVGGGLLLLIAPGKRRT